MRNQVVSPTHVSRTTKHFNKWESCTQCPLHAHRHSLVHFRGQIPAEVLFIGDHPEKADDRLSKPLLGVVGDLFDEILSKSMSRVGKFRFCITNTVCCLPSTPDTTELRPPVVTEIDSCRTRLIDFISLVSPKLIITMGGLVHKHVNVSLPTYNIKHVKDILRESDRTRDMTIKKTELEICRELERVRANG